MKTATLPSLRVDPALREAAEAMLKEGETLSAFVEASVREQVRKRQLQEEFIKRGLASRDKARETGVYYSINEVVGELRQMLVDAKAKAGAKK